MAEDVKTLSLLYENIIIDVLANKFHYDQMLAALTAFLWIRMIMFFRLNEFLGPTLTMIYTMAKLIARFMLLYMLVIVAFAAVATLTLAEMPEFANFWDSMRTYFSNAYGQYDWTIYDEITPTWKSYVGMILDMAVVLAGGIILVNLLVAILTDEYSRLNTLRQGLFWSNIIEEMPTYAYN